MYIHEDVKNMLDLWNR